MRTYAKLVADLRSFISDEQEVGQIRLKDIWRRPLPEKLDEGLTQGFTRLARGEESATVWAYLDDSESRFREGDMVALHKGSPFESMLARQLTLEFEDDEKWLLRCGKPSDVIELFREYGAGAAPCYADPDAIDLTPSYEMAIKDISTSRIGQKIVLPMLAGTLEITFDERDVAEAEQQALNEGFNSKQA
jgi:DNA replication ATP-dependent helicase Dna2